MAKRKERSGSAQSRAADKRQKKTPSKTPAGRKAAPPDPRDVALPPVSLEQLGAAAIAAASRLEPQAHGGALKRNESTNEARQELIRERGLNEWERLESEYRGELEAVAEENDPSAAPVHPKLAAAGLTPGNPGNSGGKPGRSGRRPDAYKAFLEAALHSEPARRALFLALSDTLNPGYGSLVTKIIERVYGKIPNVVEKKGEVTVNHVIMMDA